MKQYLTYLLIATVCIFCSCENSQEDINALSGKGVMKDEAANIESYLSQGGIIRAKLTAPLMIRITADTIYTEFPKTLHVDFYNADRIIESRLDSKYGKYFETQNKVYLRDSVRVITTKGDTLLCEDLWWDQNKEKFYTNKPAVYFSPTQKQAGKDGLEATQDLKTVSFLNSSGKMLTQEGDLPR